MIQTVFIVLVSSIIVSANSSALKLISGATIGDGVSMFVSDIEYERSLTPQTTGFIRLGGGSYNILNSSNTIAEVTRISLGSRFRILSAFIGIGYDYGMVDLYNSNKTKSGVISGPIIHIGKEMEFGPIITQVSVGLQLATIQINNNDASFNLGDLSEGETLLTNIECSLGYVF